MSATPSQREPQASLADYGYIALLVDRLFLALEYSAVIQRLFGLKPRREHHRDLENAGSEGKRDTLVRRNAKRADAYVLTWVAIEGLCLLLAEAKPEIFQWPALAFAVIGLSWYRILDIVQNIVNRLIFAPLRGLGQNRMASSVRTLILTILAYFEVGCCFAFLYFVWRHDLTGPSHGIADCVYFSAITELTIGYGDIVPLHGLRLIAVGQGVLGFFFAVILVARLVSELPKISGDLERRS